jgi:outer membrane protein OmpA-like peptidoglycan-associated protein
MRKILVSSLVGMSTLLAAGSALAQTTPAFDINRYQPAERGSEWFGADTLDFRGAVRPALGLTGDWAFKPLAVPTSSSTHATVVQNQFTTHFGGSLVIAERFRLGVNVPMVFYQNGDTGVLGAQTFRGPDSTRIADSRFALDIRAFGQYGDPFTVAVGGQVFMPLGSANLYTGDEKPHGIVHVLLSGEKGMYVYSANLGFHTRALHTTYAGQRIGDELMLSAAAGVRLLDRKLIVGPEMWMSRQTSYGGKDFFPGEATPIEIILGGHYTFMQDFRAGAGMGPGFGTAYGSPDFRILGSFDWAPHYEPPAPSDADADGIVDKDDACKDVPGIRTENPATNGCPAPAADRDHDGIADHMDTCPDEAGNPSPDMRAHGCAPKDRDHDGVHDQWDACPDEAGVASPDMRAHGCKVKDADNDGIPDTLDACPALAGVKTADPKTNGCPAVVENKDRDADGVMNDVDACPDEAGKPDPDPKKNGCPAAFVKEGKINITEQVKFQTASANLETDAATASILAAVADVLKKHPELKKVRVEGHTDNEGDVTRNKGLSARRADTVVKWLTAHGVDKSRLSSQGFGQEKPIADNKTPEGRKQNRRVEFHIE